MSQNRNSNGTRSRSLNVTRVEVGMRQLRAQAMGEVLNAYGLSEGSIRATQSGTLDDDYSRIEIVHRSAKSGKVVGRASMELPECDAGARVSVVSREGQSALSGYSQKCEALIAHDARNARRRGHVSEAQFVIREGRDVAAVREKHGLVGAEGYEFDGQAYAEVNPARDPGATFRIEKRRR